MEIVRDATFLSKSLRIDNKHFIDCSFIHCVLEYAGGDVTFERTQLSKCQHLFFGQARTTVRYLQTVGLIGYDPQLWGELSDEVH